LALNKQPIAINFSRGVQTKTDPYQVPVGNFLALKNSIFDVEGRLTKRNGYPLLSTLPNALQTNITTLNGNLLATGSNLYALSTSTNSWLNQGVIQPVHLSTLPLVRVSTSQSAPDAAVSSTGLTCLAYTEGSTSYYQVTDSVTGQQIVPRTTISTNSACPRVFLLNRYFIVTFTAVVSAANHLQYIAIPIANPSNPGVATDISTSLTTLNAGYDGYVANNSLYLGWSDTGTVIKLAYLSSTLVLSSAVVIPSHTATLLSVTVDTSASTAIVWVTFWDSVSNNGYTAAYNQILGSVLAVTQVITTTVINEITSVAINSVLNLFYENQNTYSYTPNAKSDFISKLTVTQAGTVSSTSVVLRSVGLASKPFIDTSGVVYMIATYGETNQPTYFLIDSNGSIYMRLAYSNGGGYQSNQVLPSVSNVDGTYLVPYLIKDFLATVNKGTGLPTGTPVNGIYTQTGVNLAKFTINSSQQYTSEIASALHLTGGQLWMYDGVKPVEHGFQVWPENIAVTTATGSGGLTAQIYNYVFTYEWTDNQGNLHRSAPSIPVSITTTTPSSTNTIKVPTLRLTYKIAPNPIRIVGYRWSVAQQTYYQFTSITSPVVNDTTIDSVTIVDAAADSAILGQTLLYTTGGTVENIAAPASIDSALFKNRLFLIDAEDPNLLWFSKEVIQTTPVEMSDLFTLYVAPTTGSQGSTGPMAALSAMDDKLIIFKRQALYYLVGNGPNNTGGDNDFTDPVYIQSSVGSDNPDSIVLTPAGIMFQSPNKGIWLLDRKLGTSYIGSPVEQFNSNIVKSAEVIPGTNQVRFILDNGITLMYDYFYQQWGTFSNLSAISATIYQEKHTYLNQYGEVYQEKAGTYLDGTSPVLLSFTTSWISLAGLQGYERLYFGYLLGTYYTPFKLNIQLGYDYNSNPTQSILVTPDNYSPNYGGDPLYGSGTPFGGPGNVFESRIFPSQQKCESFQLIVTEVYDPTYGQAAGAGLSLSGLNLITGVKKGYRTQSAKRSFG
jgi:hypothetical protein